MEGRFFSPFCLHVKYWARDFLETTQTWDANLSSGSIISEGSCSFLSILLQHSMAEHL